MAHASVRGSRPGRALALVLAVLLVGLLTTGDRSVRAKEPAKAVAGNMGEMVQFINEQLEGSWKDNKITPSKRCDDYEFLRRASLDIIGRIAKPDEIDVYMKDPSDSRRWLLVERLLAHEDYPRHWANLWANWLLTRSGVFGRGKYHEEMQVWLEDQFAENVTYDKLVKQLLTASGENSKNGAVNFILAHLGEKIPAARAKEEGEFEMVPITSRVTRLFLGIQTQCTQCHDHPFDKKLLQPHFWGVNAYFRQVERKGDPPNLVDNRRMDRPTLTLVDNPDINVDARVFYEPRSGKELMTKATFLDDKKLPMDESTKQVVSGLRRREELAVRIVEHPSFGKAYVNRLWGHFFGRGFTNPVDDFNDQNQPSHPELLMGLAEKFKHYGYNQKDLIRWICNSNAYSLSCVANKSNDKPELDGLFSRMLLKAMSPESLFESLLVATQMEPTKDARKELRDRWLDKLIANFGDDEGNEVNFNATVVQALLMMNSNDINDAVSPKEKDKGTVALALKKHNGQMNGILKDLYLASLNRPPTVREYATIGNALPLRAGMRPEPSAAPYHDVFWALLNSNEFILNH
jgi:hypothetical protein